MTDIISVALFTSFFVVLLDEKLVLGIWKAGVALLFSTIGQIILWHGLINYKIINTFASAFLCLVVLAVSELLADY